MPPIERRELITSCTQSAQLRPRRTISPSTAKIQATSIAMMNDSVPPDIGPGAELLIIIWLDCLKNVETIGINSDCTTSPQSTATAMPMPCGAGSSSAAASVLSGSLVSFTAVFLLRCASRDGKRLVCYAYLTRPNEFYNTLQFSFWKLVLLPLTLVTAQGNTFD